MDNNAVIITIGDEILRGRIVDTNFSYLAKRLYLMGIDVQIHYTVPDSEEWVWAALSEATERADIVITTGGLGPTPDDATRKGLARFLGKKLVFDNRIAQKIRAYFQRRNIPMPESNLVQAYLPEGAVPLENDEGTAPGIFARKDSKMIFMLPGPPNEMRAVFRSVELILKREIALPERHTKIYRTIGVPESVLYEWIAAEEIAGASISYYPSLRGVDIYVVAGSKQSLDRATAALDKILLPHSYSFTEDERIEKVIGDMLRERKQTLAVAESCTGGKLAGWIVDIPGSSDYFLGGVVSYSNEAKETFLGVRHEDLLEHGAVSSPVARQMAEGAKKHFGSDYGIGITGIAGPTGGTPKKPVGLVYISVATPERTFVRRYVFNGNRDAVRTRSAATALLMLWVALKAGDLTKHDFQDGGEFAE